MEMRLIKWLNIFIVTKDAFIDFAWDWWAFVKDYDNDHLPSITEQPCQCPNCKWIGTVWDCEADVDGDGGLGCPVCLEVIEVTV